MYHSVKITGATHVFEFVSRCAVFVDTGILTDGIEPQKNGRHLNAFVDVHGNTRGIKINV